MRQSLPKSKIDIPNLGFHRYFCSKRLLHTKRHLKMNFYVAFKENRWSYFFKARTSESSSLATNFGLPIFLWQTTNILKNIQKDAYISSLKKIVRVVFETPLPVSFPVYPTQLPVFRFLPKSGNIIYAFIWYCV